MGKKSDPAVHSSIALLQERFRQLQRAKELRQEQEVLRLLSEPERINPGTMKEASQSFFSSVSTLHPRPPLQGSVHGESSMQSMHNRCQDTESSTLLNIQQRDTGMHTSTFNDSDVDTSLHL